MAKIKADIHHQLDLVTRRERGRLIASLVRRLGSQHIQLAEDVAQDAVLAALANWPYQGLPDNPGAWLTRVAGNKAIDCLRRAKREESYNAKLDLRQVGDDFAFDKNHDPDIELMFLSCHPRLAQIDQLALTLRIVSGFTAKELSSVFLTTEVSVAQRLSRSKRKLQQLNPGTLDNTTMADLSPRLASVQKVIYLLFSLGYSPRLGDQLIRVDTAMEAVRLAQELARHPLTNNGTSKALASLLCFQASRLKAREDAEGRPVLLPHQDRTRWDKALIHLGFQFLQQAMDGDTLSRYHLEAGIASLYANSTNWASIDWNGIVNFYRQLQHMIDSPVVAVNASVAKAFSGQAAQALADLDAIHNLEFTKTYSPYYIARAEVLRLLNRDKEAGDCYTLAIQCGASTPVIHHLENRLTNLL